DHAPARQCVGRGSVARARGAVRRGQTRAEGVDRGAHGGPGPPRDDGRPAPRGARAVDRRHPAGLDPRRRGAAGRAAEAARMIASVRGLAVLAAIAGALLVLLLVAGPRVDGPVDRSLLPGFDAEKITSISFRHGQA